MIGRSLGRYRVIGELGEGGMGRVYLAEDPTLSRRVAIKVLPPAFAADPERRERLLSEARAASALNHPNIVTVHDLGEEDGSLYVAMEYVDGPTLRAWSASARRAPAEQLAHVRQAVRGLAVAHAAGLVHRDIKPENLMVRSDGILKVLDFGLARSATPRETAQTQEHTLPGTILGTAPYMSPEQVLGKAAGPASDVFSLGTLLYELLTARHPFAAENNVETMHRILHETPARPSTLVPGLPVELDFVLGKALAKDPDRRYANARELDLDLETCAQALAAAATPTPRGATPAGAADGTGPRSLAVLPFRNLGGAADLEFLGVGLADAVITRLSTSPDLIVRATSSIAGYANRMVDPRDAARELDVSAVLDASFQRAGTRFRATARLVEAPAGRALWAGKIDLEFDDIFNVQDEVANGIAAALTARLGGSNRGGYTPPPDVYEMYLRSQEPIRVGTRESFRSAIALLERVVAREPGYAEAWARLAKLRQSMVDSGLETDLLWYAKAEDAAKRALTIDPDNTYAHFVLGSLHLVRGRKRDAYHLFAACLVAQPNNAHVLHYFTYLFRLCNLVEPALDAGRRSIEYDPSSPFPYWMRARLLLELGRIDDGRAVLDQVRSRHPGHRTTNALGDTLLRVQGRFAESVASPLLEEAAGTYVAFERAYALLRLGRRDEALPLRASLAGGAAVDMDYAAMAASLDAWLGDFDGAFRNLTRAVELGNDSLYVFEREDLFGPLHADPRWEPFLAGMRVRCAEWAREFRWPIGAG